MASYLEFEKPIADLEEQLTKALEIEVVVRFVDSKNWPVYSEILSE